jgi:hypothetical protein
MMKWTRTSRLSIKISLTVGCVVYRILEAARALVEHPAPPRVALCERLREG